MFLKFKTNEERRKHGGTAFIEFQFCKLKENTRIRKIVSVNSIQNWKDDSLYLFVDDIDNFLEEYNDIFDSGVYNNMKSGNIDICGINYYSKDSIHKLLDTIKNKKPIDYETIILWLEEAMNYNGFYILGI